MGWIEALILGLIQGLTEFLPVSSSGHLEIGKYLLGTELEDNLTFSVVVHGATVLSTMVVFRKDIVDLFKGLFTFEYNPEKKYILKLLISMIPVGIVGIFFKDYVESFFSGNMKFVGSMLLITSALLIITSFLKNKARRVSYLDGFIMGIAQAFATLPGISRSGATIVTGLLLGIKKEEVAKFSFLMVLIPIIGANVLDLKEIASTGHSSVQLLPLMVGFGAAFFSGVLACKWMIALVKKSKLSYFGIYCLVIGLIAIIFS